MVNSMVDRATSDMLIGPDWAMNIEICDMLNHDPGQAKDVVKGIKKRLGSKNHKVQLLALTLLETVIKNCGDLVHMHVAEKDVLHEMVKIIKKKPDVHVKEKILILIDTWQEAFGGPRARYPQYYAAYQELLRIGAVFPQRSERAAPVFTPPQTQPVSSYPQILRNPEFRQEEAEASAESDFPTLSLTEIQNARGIMDVLAEMLNAVDPGNKEGLRQEVIVDLVEQCRTYKQKVLHLVNSTSDESLLCQGLALNDDLQRLLARHESMVSGTSAPGPSVQMEKPKAEPVRNLLDINDPPNTTTQTSKQPDGSSTSTASLGTQPRQLLPPTPPSTNGTVTTPPVKLNPKMDLLSGDDYNSPTAENPLALVPVGPPQPTSPAVSHQQNALALVDMFSQNTNNIPNSFNAHPTIPGQQAYPSTTPQFQQQQQQQNFQPQQPGFYSNGMPQYEPQSLYTQGTNNNSPWNGHNAQPQPPSSVYGAHTGESLPPPPWEAQPIDNSQVAGSQYPQPTQVSQVVVTHSQPIMGGAQPQPMANGQMVGMYIQPITGGHMSPSIYPQQMQGQYMGMVPQPMQSSHTAPMYPQQMYGTQMGGYGYGGPQQEPQAQFLEQRMYGLSVRDDSALTNSSYQVSASSYSYGQSMKPSKPEDKLFGDLVDMAKSKPKTAAPGRAGSM